VSENFDPFENRRNLGSADLDEIERREMQNIIQSYHGNYDIFAEVAQNAVDAVEKRWRENSEGYIPSMYLALGPCGG